MSILGNLNFFLTIAKTQHLLLAYNVHFPITFLKPSISLIHKYGLFIKVASAFSIGSLYLHFPLNLDPLIQLIKQINSYI